MARDDLRFRIFFIEADQLLIGLFLLLPVMGNDSVHACPGRFVGDGRKGPAGICTQEGRFPLLGVQQGAQHSGRVALQRDQPDRAIPKKIQGRAERRNRVPIRIGQHHQPSRKIIRKERWQDAGAQETFDPFFAANEVPGLP